MYLLKKESRLLCVPTFTFEPNAYFHKFTFKFPAISKNDIADAQIFVVGVQPITLNTGYGNGRHLLSPFCAAYDKKGGGGCMKTGTIFRGRANDVWCADTINIRIKITQSYL
jgi:hypothetical protein